MMKHFLAPTAVFILSHTILCAPVSGQTVYKCGTSYSQQPCAGAIALDVSDGRTPAQKAQTDAAAAQAAKAAAKLEKDRLALEKVQTAALSRKVATAYQPARAASSSKAGRVSAHQRKKKQVPEYFTARVAPEKIKKKADQRSDDPTRTGGG